MSVNLYKNLVNKFGNKTDSDIIVYRSIAIIILFIITIYVVYIAPVGVDKLFCAVLLIMFWYSKADYFWFAFFLIISSFPAGLFTESTFAAVRRLPIYSPIAKMSLSVMDLFLIVALIKALAKGKRSKIVDVFKIKSIAILIPYVLLTSFFFGITLKLFLNQTVRGLFFYTLFYSFPALIYSKKEVYKFMTMFFPFVFFELFAQFYTIKTGNEFANFFNPGAVLSIFDTFSGEIRAVPTGYIIMRLAFVFAFVLLENKDRIISKFYLLLVILISISSVVVAATRSAIIMLVFIFIMYFVTIAKKKPHVLMQIFIISVLMVMLLDLINVVDLNTMVGSSYSRFIGAVSVEEGTVKAEDTFDNRITNRLPVLLDAISKSIFIGYGFSDKFYEYYDGHLGGVLLGLLQVGIFGYTLYIVFIFNIFSKCFKYIRKLTDDNSFLAPIKVFTLSFFGYLIVNLTVDPIYVLNTSTLPQDIFIHLVIATFFINLAMKEHKLIIMEKKLAYAR